MEAPEILRITLWRKVVGLGLAAGVVGVWVGHSSGKRSESRTHLVDSFGKFRILEGRLAGFPYQPLTHNPIPPELMLSGARRFNTWARRQPTSQVAVEVALLWLLEGRRDTALGYLGEALPRRGDAASLSDLAAIYLDKDIAEEPVDLIRALDAGTRAVQVDPQMSEARFNLALALERTRLTRQAISAWRDALEAEGGSAWSGEIRQRLARLEKPVSTWSGQVGRLERAVASRRQDDVREIVRRFPFEARTYGEEERLGDWAEAWLGGRKERADLFLATVRAVGLALAETRGDSLLADAVSAIDQTPSEDRGELAHGHRAYRTGMALLDRNLSSEAIGQLRLASEHLRVAGSPFVHWADLALAICWQYKGQYARALQILSRLTASKQYPSLAARANWIAGLIHVKKALPVEAGVFYRKALTLYERLEERRNISALQVLLAENLRLQGESAEAWRFRLRALESARAANSPVWLHNVLFDAAEASLGQGLPRVALLFQNEMVEEARQEREPMTVAEALVQRSRTLSRLGRFQPAAQDLIEAQWWCDRIDEGELKAATQAEIEAAEGERLFWPAPAESLKHWDRAITFYRRDRSHLLLPDLYRRRAEAQLRSGEIEKAETDLHVGIAECETIRQRLGKNPLSVAYFDQARAIFDSMVDLQASQNGRAVMAFDWAERGRARNLLDLVGAQLLTAQAIQENLPEGATLVAYTVLRRKTLAWALTPTRLVMASIEVSQEELAKKVSTLRRALAHKDKAVFQAASRDLYSLLIAPLGDLVRTHGEVIIVPDKVLTSLSFAALENPGTGRFLIEDTSLVYAPSGSHFVRAQQRARRRRVHFGEDILVIGDPAFDRHAFAGQSRLLGAAEEARAVSALYKSPRILLGEEATKERVLREARHATILHIAAHARTELGSLGFILLAPNKRSGGVGVLYVNEIYHQSFPMMELVVLAGCGTAAGDLSPGEGMMSLARPFLATGVPSVVATLWSTSDENSKKLFLDFHRALLQGTPPAEALRHAQLRALANPSQEIRWPENWAAFELIGGS